MARLEPVALADMDERTRSLLSGLGPGEGAQPYAIFATVAHHPKLLASWLPFGGRLLAGGRLDRRHTELAILRTAYNTGCDYEWGHHVRICAELGIERAAVDRIPAGPAADGWEPVERLLLAAVDELHNGGRISGSLWDALSAHLDAAQCLELCFLVGQYEMLSMALLSVEVDPDPGLEALPDHG